MHHRGAAARGPGHRRQGARGHRPRCEGLKRPGSRPKPVRAASLEEVLSEARKSLGLSGPVRPVDPAALRAVAVHCDVEPPPDLMLAWSWLSDPSERQDMESFSPEGMIGATNYLADKVDAERWVAVLNHGSVSEFLCLDPQLVAHLRSGRPVSETRLVDADFVYGQIRWQGPVHTLREWVAWRYLVDDDWDRLGLRHKPPYP